MQARVIAVANQKGGTAKTTSTIHLGAALAELGKKVLLCDLDPQGHLGEGFGIVTERLKCEMSDVLSGEKRISEIIMQGIRPNLDLAPSNIRLSDMELSLVNLRFREFKLQRALDPVLSRYDFVFLDCPPSLGLLTVNALIAAHAVLIPMSAEFLSMLGVSLLIRTIDTIRAEANAGLVILGILPTHFRRTVHSREVVERTREELGSRIRVFQPVINDSTRFKEASAQGKTVFELTPDLEGALAYRAIAKEIANGPAIESHKGATNG